MAVAATDTMASPGSVTAGSGTSATSTTPGPAATTALIGTPERSRGDRALDLARGRQRPGAPADQPGGEEVPGAGHHPADDPRDVGAAEHLDHRPGVQGLVQERDLRGERD